MGTARRRRSTILFALAFSLSLTAARAGEPLPGSESTISAPPVVQNPAVTSPVGERALRPQPEPPGAPSRSLPGETRMLRPQPEPPGKVKAPRLGTEALAPGETRMLRPQPEPPGHE